LIEVTADCASLGVGNNGDGRQVFQFAMRVKSAARIVFIPVFAILLLGAFFYALRLYEYAITFHPRRYDLNRPWKVPGGAEDVWLTTRDEVKLHGWFISSPTRPSQATLIHFHGNAGNIGNVGWVGKSLSHRGYDVLLFDYRGYGRSEGQIGDERDIYADADAAYDYLVNQRRVAPDKIVLYGQSLGTTAASDIGARRGCGALIIESGMSSASNLALTAVPWLPRWLHGIGKNRFEIARKIAGVHCPVLIAHGDPDSVIPTQNGRDIYAAANEPKRLILLPGVGHNVIGSGGEKYLDEIDKFIQSSLAKNRAAQ
jgi:pimeloyl-ACP methyl ester carboxylesterase